jgi:hypothetical protein
MENKRVRRARDTKKHIAVRKKKKDAGGARALSQEIIIIIPSTM